MTRLRQQDTAISEERTVAVNSSVAGLEPLQLPEIYSPITHSPNNSHISLLSQGQSNEDCFLNSSVSLPLHTGEFFHGPWRAYLSFYILY